MFYFLIILCLCTTAGIRYGWTHTLLQVLNPQIWAVCLTKSSILSSETMRTSKIKKKKIRITVWSKPFQPRSQAAIPIPGILQNPRVVHDSEYELKIWTLSIPTLWAQSAGCFGCCFCALHQYCNLKENALWLWMTPVPFGCWTGKLLRAHIP